MRACYLILIVSIIIVNTIQAQTINGKVIDAETSDAIPFANVFLNNTTVGTVTDMHGDFHLNTKLTGAYDLIVSFVGYDKFSLKVVVSEGSLKTVSVKLSPYRQQLSTVEVKAPRDKEWEKKLKKFKKIFLGEDDLAAGTTIKNPWVIDFPSDPAGGKFIAKAVEPIEIDNQSLGYNLRFYMSDFWQKGSNVLYVGNALFTELKSNDQKEIAKWSTNRKFAYNHSLNRFLKSIVDHRISGDGFSIYAAGPLAIRYDTTALIEPGIRKGFYRIKIKGDVEVRGQKAKKKSSTVSSWIRLTKDTVVVNQVGVPANPLDIEVWGDMSKFRAGGMLPLDYQSQVSSGSSNDQNDHSKDGEVVKLLDSLTNKSEVYSQSHRLEKVYVHFDKPFYMLGEESWYRAYIVTEPDLTPTDISSVLYVDWIESTGNIVKRQLLKIENGGASGDLTIDNKFHDGVYTVRAYTNWMRNENPELLFSKRIRIFSPAPVQPTLSNSAAGPKVDLMLFPEGGTLVSGIKTIVAFKATDANGRGVDVKGEVVDDQNNILSTFKSIHNGMGIFPIVPQFGTLYHVVLDGGNTFMLPPTLANGVVLGASNIHDNKIVVRIQSNVQNKRSAMYLIGYSRGAISYSASIKSDGNANDIVIPKDDLPEGVMRLILFDESLTPQCERLIFIRKNENPNFYINSDKAQYSARDSITLTFKVADKEGKGLQTSLSVSVADAGLVTHDTNSENIYTRLLLQSDIKGIVQDPNWYFQSRTVEKNHALDVLMLTQSWPRYQWKKILNLRDDSVVSNTENGLTMKGQILTGNKPAAYAQFLLIPLQHSFANMYECDSLGHFVVSGLEFSDSLTYAWKIIDKNGVNLSDATVRLDTLWNIAPLNSDRATDQSQTVINDVLRQAISERFATSGVWRPEKATVLQEVVVEAAKMKIRGVNANTIAVKPEPLDVKSRLSSSTFIGRYAKLLPFAIMIESQQWGVVTGSGFVPIHITIDGMSIETSGHSGSPDLILSAIPIEQIAEVYISGSSNITVRTKPAPEVDNPASIKRKLNGYSTAREFYIPKYWSSNDPEPSIDNRLTLYWNANLRTDKDGVATATFYNSDKAKKLLIVMEGCADGIPISATKVVGLK